MIPAGFELGHTITKVEALPKFRVRLTYTDGFVGELDFWPYIEWGEAVAPLKDPDLFKTAHTGSGGSSLEWIGPRDRRGLRVLARVSGPFHERTKRRIRSFGILAR